MISATFPVDLQALDIGDVQRICKQRGFGVVVEAKMHRRGGKGEEGGEGREGGGGGAVAGGGREVVGREEFFFLSSQYEYDSGRDTQ